MGCQLVRQTLNFIYGLQLRRKLQRDGGATSQWYQNAQISAWITPWGHHTSGVWAPKPGRHPAHAVVRRTAKYLPLVRRVADQHGERTQSQSVGVAWWWCSAYEAVEMSQEE